MSEFITAVAYMLAAISIIALLISVAAYVAWRFVYYGCNCRRAPIQKAVLLTAAMLWTMSAIVLKLL